MQKILDRLARLSDVWRVHHNGGETSEGKRRHHLWLVALLLPVLVVALSSRSQAAGGRVVSLAVDGQRLGFSTDAKSVSEVLARAQVRLSRFDLVEPSLDTTINTGVFYINIYRAKPAIVVDGRREIKVNTPYTNPKLIATRSAGLKVHSEDEFKVDLIRDFVDQGTLGHRITINRSVPITLVVDGKKLHIRSGQATVRDLLKEKKIKFDKNDLVKPGLSTSLTKGLKIEVIRVGKKVVSLEETVPFSIQNIFDNNKPAGYEEVRQEGVNGRQLVTYEIRYHDGREAKRKLLEKVVIKQAVTKIVVRGETNSDGVWANLRACESGGDYGRNSGNGYYGAYQFGYGTWQSVAPSEWAGKLPSDSPPNIQDIAAQRLQARSGWGQWPACAAKLGLY